MKKALWGIFAFLGILLIGCEKPVEPEIPLPPVLEKIVLDTVSLTMNVGDEYQLKASFVPEEVVDVELIWRSSNEETVTVSNGKVKAVAPGKAQIIVGSGEIFASCDITVNKEEEPAPPAPEKPELKAIVLDTVSLVLNIGEEYQLKATLDPADAEDVTLVWTSSDSAVVSVKDGKVTALAAGTAAVSVSSGAISAKCDVTVKEKEEPTPPEPEKPELKAIVLDTVKLSLEIGEEYQLKATLDPADVEDVTLVWTSSDAAVASVKDGKVTALAAGTADITVSCGEISAKCAVTVNEKEEPTPPEPVKPELEAIVLDVASLELNIGDEHQFTVTLEPADVEDVTLVWTSSDASVVSVTDGKVTALTAGNATVTVSAGEISATCDVVVNTPELTGLLLDMTSLVMEVGDERVLNVTLVPGNAVAENLVWSSTDETVVTVTDGKVTAVAAGTADITVSSGVISATCSVTVNAPAAPEPGAAKVGDYFYSDGTWSTIMDNTKTVIGVVFYVGDPTADDPTLAADYAGCTHGLVLSITEVDSNPWQLEYFTYNATVASWLEANAGDYESISSDNLNKIQGYNNTKAIEEFNAANSSVKVDVVQTIVDFRASHATPASTSEWYLPSAKEVGIISTGNSDGDVASVSGVDNLNLINEVLGTISGAVKLEGMTIPGLGIPGMGGGGFEVPGHYWSSTESDKSNAYHMGTKDGAVLPLDKRESGKVRPVLAF